jgi:predicted transcriptional regulator of viral defense system
LGSVVAIQEYLSANQVFSAGDFRRAFPGSRTDRNLLNRAVAAGRVGRPKRGLYTSRVGPFSRSQASPFDVASKAADDVVFCLLSALQLHGVAHNAVFRTQFYTAHKVAPFAYEGQEFAPMALPKHRIDSVGLLSPSGVRYRVTTREQTVVDCLDRVPLAGGVENVLRSVGGFRHLDAEAAIGIAGRFCASTRARLGWVLQAKADTWGVPRAALDTLAGTLGAGPYYFASQAGRRTATWVNRWRLYLPGPETEMTSWLNQ